eukprot:scaffold870_cov268-Pinguiococcus_pyrenoidosus.AAC.40
MSHYRKTTGRGSSCFLVLIVGQRQEGKQKPKREVSWADLVFSVLFALVTGRGKAWVEEEAAGGRAKHRVVIRNHVDGVALQSRPSLLAFPSGGS